MESQTESTDAEKHDDRDAEKEVWSTRYTRESFYAEETEANIRMEGSNILAATFPKLIYKITQGTSGT